MKQWIIFSILALGLTLACAERSFSQEAQTKPSPATALSDNQIAESFYKILEQELEKENISLSFQAGIALNRIISSSTVAMRGENSERLREAEDNFRIFGQALIKSAQEKAKGPGVRITLEDIREVLSPREKGKLSLCPLFPICK